MLSRIADARSTRLRQALAGLFAAGALCLSPVVQAQAVERVDPDAAIDADLATPSPAPTYQDRAADLPPEPVPQEPAPVDATPVVTSAEPSAAASEATAQPAVAAAQGDTYKQDDLIGAAEGLFGKGAEGLARLIENILREQGEPNGYIVGREAGGAFIFGLRYGSGTLHHRVEGQRPVYWTGPSLGLDAGANASSTFVLIYNLHDSEELFERFPAGEGAGYLIGGLNASYLRRGDTVLIPIRAGLGARAGVNVGYMKFSRRQRWLPF